MSQKVPFTPHSSLTSSSWHLLLISFVAIGLSIMCSIKILSLESRLVELESKCTAFEAIISSQREEMNHVIPQLREELQSLSTQTSSWVCSTFHIAHQSSPSPASCCLFST